MYIFNSRFDTLTVVLRPTRKVVIGTQVVVEEGLRARFEQGLFTTEDEETAELLRQKIKKSRDLNVVEISAEDRMAFERAAKLKNVRESTTAPALSRAFAAAPSKEPAEKIICPICDPPKEFKTQKDLNLHLMEHRPGVVPDKPKVEEPVAPPAETMDTEAPEIQKPKKSPGKVKLGERVPGDEA